MAPLAGDDAPDQRVPDDGDEKCPEPGRVMLAAGGTEHYSDGGVRRYLPDLFPYQKLRMSRQDIRDEYKQMEGDPHVKGRIRQMQRAAARRRMMEDVPKADVIVTNPTHYPWRFSTTKTK